MCLAAASAMERGRWALRTARLAAVVGGSAAVSRERVAAVCRLAVADFWPRLHGFVALGVPRRGWRLVGPDHPVQRAAAGRIVWHTLSTLRDLIHTFTERDRVP